MLLVKYKANVGAGVKGLGQTRLKGEVEEETGILATASLQKERFPIALCVLTALLHIPPTKHFINFSSHGSVLYMHSIFFF